MRWERIEVGLLVAARVAESRGQENKKEGKMSYRGGTFYQGEERRKEKKRRGNQGS